MAEKTLNASIQLRKDTLANFMAAGTVYKDGEILIVTDIGDDTPKGTALYMGRGTGNFATCVSIPNAVVGDDNPANWNRNTTGWQHNASIGTYYYNTVSDQLWIKYRDYNAGDPGTAWRRVGGGVADAATKLTTARTITVSGDGLTEGSASFDGTQNVTISTGLTDTGVTADTYNNVTVDAKGRVTAGANKNYAETDTKNTFTQTQSFGEDPAHQTQLDSSGMTISNDSEYGTTNYQYGKITHSASASGTSTEDIKNSTLNIPLGKTGDIAVVGTEAGYVPALDTNGKLPSSTLPTGTVTSVETTGTGNAVTTGSISGNKLTLTKGATFAGLGDNNFRGTQAIIGAAKTTVIDCGSVRVANTSDSTLIPSTEYTHGSIIVAPTTSTAYTLTLPNKTDTVAVLGDIAKSINNLHLGTASTKNTGTAAGNVPVLDKDGKLDSSIIPATAITDTFVVGSEEAMLALDAQVGDVAVRTDVNKSFILQKTPASTLANWVELLAPDCKVISVNGKQGAVVLTTDDVAEGSTNLYYTQTRADARAKAVFDANITPYLKSTDAENTYIKKTNGIELTDTVTIFGGNA